MSLTLGKIHYWLYDKIHVSISLEALLATKSTEAFGDLAEELYDTACEMYGPPLADQQPLEEIIDHQHIHNWLQHQIALTEIRLATFIKDLTDCMGISAIELINQTFYTHGVTCGQAALKQTSQITPEIIYNTMQNYYINGMPCDSGDVITESKPTSFSWVNTHEHQITNWKKSGISIAIMMQAYQSWFKGFVFGMNERAAFSTDATKTPPVYTIYTG